jgi:hypothetical protein
MGALYEGPHVLMREFRTSLAKYLWQQKYLEVVEKNETHYLCLNTRSR